MKTIRNTALLVTLLTFLFTSIAVSADETDTDSANTGAMYSVKVAKDALKAERERIQAERADFKAAKDARNQEMKENRAKFKEAHKGEMKEAFSGLSDDTRAELKELKTEFKTELQDLHNELKNKDLSLEEREELKNSLQELSKTYGEKVNELVSVNEKASEFLAERKALRDENKALRNEARADRKETREQLQFTNNELIDQYKEKYLNQLAVIIPKVSDEKLEKISNKVAVMVEKIEENTRLSDSRKEKILSQIISIQEIMEEELESRAEAIEEIDLDDILD